MRQGVRGGVGEACRLEPLAHGAPSFGASRSETRATCGLRPERSAAVRVKSSSGKASTAGRAGLDAMTCATLPRALVGRQKRPSRTRRARPPVRVGPVLTRKDRSRWPHMPTVFRNWISTAPRCASTSTSSASSSPAGWKPERPPSVTSWRASTSRSSTPAHGRRVAVMPEPSTYAGSRRAPARSSFGRWRSSPGSAWSPAIASPRRAKPSPLPATAATIGGAAVSTSAAAP